MVKSNKTLYYKFKTLLFNAKRVLLDDKGREKLAKDFDMIKLRELYESVDMLRDDLVDLVYGGII